MKPALLLLILSCTLNAAAPVLNPNAILYTNLPYAGDGSERRWLADVAVPGTGTKTPEASDAENGQALRPMLIFIHGGGWHEGRKDYLRWNSGVKWAAKNGFVYVRINYRLAQHAPFPAALHDVMNAVRYCRLHAEEFGADPSKIVLAGSSAGAHLATLAAFAANDERFETGSLYPGVSAKVSAVAGLGGIYDLEAVLEQHRDIITDFLGGPESVNPDSLRMASPATYLDADDPPLLLLHSERDATAPVSEARNLFNAAMDAGIPTHFIPVDSDKHTVPENPAHWEQVVWFRKHAGSVDGGSGK